jgi:hypothetical protein
MTLLAIALVLIVCFGTYGWFSNKSTRIKEDAFNQKLRLEIQAKATAFEKEIRARKVEFNDDIDQFDRNVSKRTAELDEREKYIKALQEEFSAGFARGRKWLAAFIADADQALDKKISYALSHKSHPAIKAAEAVADAYAERRSYKERVKFLEYQLLSLKEYFPFIEEYEDLILDEAVPLTDIDGNLEILEGSDEVLRFISRSDYERMMSAERNQLALDRYLRKSWNALEIGRSYERYLGYLYERDGWEVDYHGIYQGREDMGRDLICKRNDKVRIVQAKYWKKDSVIHEKHIFQLFGSVMHYQMETGRPALGSFETTTTLSPLAREVAKKLSIEVKEQQQSSKTYPMIKCNINRTTGDRIYHLPFDQQYDRTKIIVGTGEFYAATAAEAEAKGFRRARRHYIIA